MSSLSRHLTSGTITPVVIDPPARRTQAGKPGTQKRIASAQQRDWAFLFEIHGDQGDLQLTATSRASMQRQELNVRGARGDEKELAELPIPGKYRWVPEGLAPDSRYNVAQLYARLAEGIRNGKPISPGFDSAVTRHRLIDAIVRASETGIRQLIESSQ